MIAFFDREADQHEVLLSGTWTVRHNRDGYADPPPLRMLLAEKPEIKRGFRTPPVNPAKRIKSMKPKKRRRT